MSVFGQPKAYSEILGRIFVFTVVTGLICTFFLADASPDFKTILESIDTEADLGILKGLKALYVIIPLVVAFFSRLILLHDRISDIFKIRFRFDTQFVLYPLAQGVGISLSENMKTKINLNRKSLIYKVFYPYAGFEKPLIDIQLVRTAADRWGWFWVFVESSVLFLIASVILAVLGKWNSAFIFLFVFNLELIVIYIYGISCKKSAGPQVEEILADLARRSAILKHFQQL